MPCYHPLEGYYSRELNKSGKRSIVFNSRHALTPDVSITLPCGKCIGCRLERSQEWATRCMHEAKMHQENCFITLTYSEESLQTDDSLHKEDFQKFLKRLRKKIYPQKIRYFYCGEYGDKTSRPHFHACIFGYRPSDLKLYKKSPTGDPLYNSKLLEHVWNNGHVVIGELTYETAAYVARYTLKKITGPEASDHYSHMNAYGEIIEKLPEYCNGSLKPAIGKTWLDQNGQYIQDHDFIVVNGRKSPIPKYYDRVLERTAKINLEDRKEKRAEKARPKKSDNTPERLAVKKAVHEAQIKQLKRNKQK